ncbi:UDP-glucose 4-epimerase GalE [Agrobacterium vitis]|uniref:UDP-glucose 4-epimerase n=1 Tax=Agrobacterium vitis TaxID=373 RepID=A0AAE4WIA0_AGRVI|nr:UDP-glucose 4-epimerase GalE [Agrobacterium vitis]MCF1501191.1 UDP-glucose 4-epimerase GalE [Allorhizobium sp. Av2]MCM2440551.1 UDP-glucose 4-epimerase GalE [Agrobacterium vitis]MUZ59537.1 UDP-glucose 4-epimerase GalE [Agrobacterium vitis]MVA66701.1 UDP-glucose 4-epimerase GalE [Agrobacterium vitis]MVA87564.1 UDP-glucose 4-epimerase GalE [Agrobacterium vitis]
MAILVTGGAGYIGSHMVWALVEAGHEVVVLDRLSTGFRGAVAPGARFYLGDIGDRDLLRQIFAHHAIEAIFHFAGSVVVSESIANPMDYYTNNTVNSSILIEETVRAGIGKLVFSSTAAVYGAPVEDRPVREADPLNPQSPYGQSKLMTELMLADTARAHPDFRFVALRYFNVAGCDAKGRTGQSTRGATHLIKAACETALGLRPYITVFGTDYPTRDGTGIRDYIHVDDLVSAHQQALAYLQDGGPSLVANCGYGDGASVKEVIAAVERVAGQRLPTVFDAPRPGDAACMIADPGLARQRLGWMAENPGLDAIVRTSLEWERRCLRTRATPLEFVREKWKPVFPKRQTQTKETRVCLVQYEPDRL